MAQGDDLGEIAARLAPLHPRHNTVAPRCTLTSPSTRLTSSALRIGAVIRHHNAGVAIGTVTVASR
jgi:hypothetical protein